ncbi:MAG: nucleotide exchange factor GrpE [Elusimicrobia bacterium RIFOXYA2_FULL_39_19]|nr:MAG: nucleotide exchange factor GrpE [Elusimicrobia bacterium RIFOXYA2_FULL_39_19]
MNKENKHPEHEKNSKKAEPDDGLITEEELKPVKPAENHDKKTSDKDEIKELNSQLLRLRAEFENYRTRVEKEKQRKYILGKESVFSKIIDFEDVFEKAVLSLHSWNQDKNPKDISVVIQGVELLHKEFSNFLKKEEVKQIETADKIFDPHFHEVMGYEYCNDKEEGTIIKELQKGYMFDEYVIRPSKVIVAKEKPKEETKETPENGEKAPEATENTGDCESKPE